MVESNKELRIGLVLAAGGGKGSYQIGVWKYLIECGLDKKICAVAGASVGALNAALFIQGDYKLAEHIWTNKIQDTIVNLDKKVVLNLLLVIVGLGIGVGVELPMLLVPAIFTVLVLNGLFSRSGFLNIIHKYINIELITNDSRPIIASCLSMPTLSKTYFEINGCCPNKTKSILCATSAIPIIFPPENIDGVKYIDSGIPFVGEYLPIRALYERGCDAVIVVHLDRNTTIRDKSAFNGMDVYEIVPRKSLGYFLTGLLDFSKRGAYSRIETGYNDAKNVLKAILNK